MKLLTIFTPTYNRAYCLHHLYESLQRQTCQNFEWLIIDDGSNDNTRQLVEEWISDQFISIRYIYQNNQGMHGAHNTAYESITTELNTCIDSDDYMPDDAVEKIVSFWKKYGSDQIAGFIGLDADTDGRVIGTELPTDLRMSTLFNLYYKHGVRGDKKLVYRTSLTHRYPYPLFEGERYVGLAYKYYMLDQHYELLLLNEVLCCVDYLPDGSTRNMMNQYLNNPRGFAFYRKALMNLPYTDLMFKYRQAIHYISSCIMYKNKLWLKEAPIKWLAVAALIPGYLLNRYIIYKSTSDVASKGKTNDYPVG